jgi:hypothetical protein
VRYLIYNTLTINKGGVSMRTYQGNLISKPCQHIVKLSKLRKGKHLRNLADEKGETAEVSHEAR